MNAISGEISRRHSNTLALWQFFQANPNKWIGWKRIQRIAGACAWRTRISDCRKFASDIGGDVQWNKNIKDSRYRFLLHKPIGPDAAIPRPRKLF